MTKRNLSDLLRQEAAQDESAAAPSTPPSEDDSQSTAHRARKSSTPPAAELEHQVQELKAALVQAAEQEQDLQDQIKNLQNELKHKEQQIVDLQVDIENVEKLQRELAETKEVILQLSEANTQMAKTLDELKNPPQANPPQASKAIQRKDPIPRKSALSSLTPIRHHSVQHGPPSSKPARIDVGWMD